MKKGVGSGSIIRVRIRGSAPKCHGSPTPVKRRQDRASPQEFRLLKHSLLRIRFLSQCGSGSREPNLFGSGSWSDFAITKKFDTYLQSTKVRTPFWKARNLIAVFLIPDWVVVSVWQPDAIAEFIPQSGTKKSASVWFVYFDQLSCSWIRIRIPDTDSGSRRAQSMRIQIHNTENK
jgi:hypothetical protein